ncbi:heavy-metal-associated domain-containing protein [Sphingomonas sp.]|uniref:heavy-metal-associated domain-containing protein n=1 Tax=Sphingomonas sp. TaxID=28214 RepID=UPI00286B957D|nr:heavy-metal-associated domain-containing protein [Sphingomonas sp.]
MIRRPFLPALLLFLAAVLLSGALYAQLESGERGILPLDSSGTLEIGGIHVDVSSKDALSARYAGWRLAQRDGFRALWAKTHGRPVSEAPDLPDPTLDGLVSSIIVEREQIGPNRYIADLGILFDRARAGELLGVGGEMRRSAPMLLIPVTVSGGTATSVELRNGWQRAWAQFRTSQSSIDYVRISGMGVDPLLVNAAQSDRPGRGWWRNLVDLYGAADILVAEVQIQRLYPGGPAQARFIARHGPDNEIVGGFSLTAANSDAIPAMMNEGVRRMDELYSAALAAGRLQRDSTLDLPAPPPLPEEVVEGPPVAQQMGNAFQVQIAASNVNTYNFAMAHLRTLPGMSQVIPQSINPSGTSYVLIGYHGTGPQLAAALSARGWKADANGTVIRMSGGAGPPPPIPQPRPPVATPTSPVTNSQ